MVSNSSDSSRRGFLKTSAIVAAGSSLLAGLNPVRAAHVGGNDTIRIGLVGCGGRGRGAAEQALNTEGPQKSWHLPTHSMTSCKALYRL